MKGLKHHEYSGRVDDENKPERFHQVVKQWAEGTGSGRPVFIGFCSEEGVRRNKGRPGAKGGPYKVREKMASLPYTDTVFDYGSISAEQDLEASQEALGQCVAEVFANGQFPMIVGGGHETLYGHYLGVRRHYPDARVAVVNLDAHFDMRDEAPSSGTMFHQILTGDENIDYFVFGIQSGANTKTLFDAADAFGVKYALIEEMRNTGIFEESLESLGEYDAVFATLCMDSVQQGVAPGTSAPSPNGFTASEVHELVGNLAKLPNIVSFDISEVAPRLDIDERTSGLAASLFHRFMIEKETFR
ncbi:formimidoylglutamase [Salinicoccus carnicancri]|uniref:formimidoylglutamase n=1 Tax=Salinicoccus carnicancri TaxID=558170 RepID=UPI0002EBFDC9|nr:formimidoylglutamase [Salinicoccus carnicancri]